MSDVVRNERSRLLGEISRAQQRLAALDRLLPVQRVATALHKAQCRDSHIDGCGWEYDTWDKSQTQLSTRRLYLQRAQNLWTVLIRRYPEDEIESVIYQLLDAMSSIVLPQEKS